MDTLLARYPGPIAIFSGEGERGTWAIYEGARTARAIRARLTREWCHGDRWARAYVYAYESAQSGPICVELETSEPYGWPLDLPTRVGPGRPVGADGKARRIDARIPGALLDRLDAEAETRGVTRSRALVQAIRGWLGEPDPA